VGHGDSLAEALARIEAPTLIIHRPEDLIFHPALVQQTADLIAVDGTPVKRVEIAGARGHLDGLLSLVQVGDVLEAFLDE
jgi:homoserine O-acetyltransferase/O-succinyltransferase